MRKQHLALGIALASAVCALPTRAAAKPQTATPSAAAEAAQTTRTGRTHAAPETTAAAARAGAAALAAGLGMSIAGTAGGAASSVASRARPQSKREPAPPCLAAPVPLARTRGDEIEPGSLSLTLCDGSPNLEALDALSILARSRDLQRPAPAEVRAYQRLPVDRAPRGARRDPGYVTAQIMRLHPGLLERLQKVAARFPGRTLEIVSGHRPDARYTSRHHHGRALDFRVQGVPRERLRDFLRTFDETGVGYYPNSSFVHMDVRDDRGYWVDRSGPGERADYGVWPPPRHEIQHAQSKLLAGALAELGALGLPNLEGAAPTRSKAVARRPEGLRDEGDELSEAEIRRLRADALRALDALR